MTYSQVAGLDAGAYIYDAPFAACMGQADWGNRTAWPKGYLRVWREQALHRDTEDAGDAQQVADLRVRSAALEALDCGAVDAGPLGEAFLCQVLVNAGYADAVAHGSLGFADPLILFC